jgi:hypothetical protein
LPQLALFGNRERHRNFLARFPTAAYFVNDGSLNLMRHVLRGLGRGVLETLGCNKATVWP